MADIFLSYATLERNDIQPIKAFLEQRGLSVFLDIEGLDAGDAFPKRLEEEITAARLVISCWSPHSLSRAWVRKECAIALKQGKLLPILIKPLGETDMPYAFFEVHHEDMSNFLTQGDKKRQDRLVSLIAKMLGDNTILSRHEALSAERPIQTPTEHLPPINVGQIASYPFSASFVRRAFNCARAACKIVTKLDGRMQAVASGFAIEGHVLHESLGSEPFVVTANYAIALPGPDRHGGARYYSECEAHFFDDMGEDHAAGFKEIVFESRVAECDFTILRPILPLPACVTPLSSWHAAPLPERARDEDGIRQHVFLVGFPGGGDLAFSLADNELLDHDADQTRLGQPVRIHHRLSTMGGSGGAPLFDSDSGELLGLHHAGHRQLLRLAPRSGTYAAKEAIYFGSIREEVARQLLK